MQPAPTTTSIISTLLDWFEREGVEWPWRQTRDRWIILVSEVCLQQTQVARAAPKIALLVEHYPTPKAMADAPLGDVLEHWQGLGYPRRAKNLWNAAQIIATDGWPEKLRDLPGVGEYTEAALQCFADELPVVPPDINTRRVATRLFPDGLPEHATEPRLSNDPWTWGQSIMELGQRICTAKAQCTACPVQQLCPSAGTADVIASPRQSTCHGSFRQRRGVVLRRLTRHGIALVEDDREAALSLVEDGLAGIDATGETLIRL